MLTCAKRVSMHLSHALMHRCFKKLHTLRGSFVKSVGKSYMPWLTDNWNKHKIERRRQSLALKSR